MGYGFLYFNPLAAGTYKIVFDPTWGSKDVRDYTIQVYSKEKTTITDSNGKNVYDTSIIYNTDSTSTDDDTDDTPTTPTTPTIPTVPTVPTVPTTDDIFTQL